MTKSSTDDNEVASFPQPQHFHRKPTPIPPEVKKQLEIRILFPAHHVFRGKLAVKQFV